jgi:sugar (pentulose or hexulose) kinase
LSNHIGLDVGTTTITAVVVDGQTGDVVSKATVPNDAETTSSEDKKRGRSEWDADRVLDIVRTVLTESNSSGHEVAAIGVTGQMHGTLLVDEQCEPAGPFIGWQDQRAAEGYPDSDGSVISDFLLAVDETDPSGKVCRPKVGYLGPTLAWLARHNQLPDRPFSASFLPDFLSARLTGSSPVTDATNAAGSGLFDVVDCEWYTPLIERLQQNPDNLPRVVFSGSLAGQLAEEWADTGIDPGIPVCVACGDNQASFLGSVKSPEDTVLINLGTGGQVSVSADSPAVGAGLEARPHVDGKYILVGAGLVGGRTYAWLRDFYLEIGRSIFGIDGDSEDVYERMTLLADHVQSGVDGLQFEPLLTGTREDPRRRGVIQGIGNTNFSAGHLSRALMEGVIAQFKQLYRTAISTGATERNVLVGSGNGIRKNRVLREIAEDQFGLRMRVPGHTEEAAYGAAMQAMVLGGDRSSLEDAAEVIQYA